VSRRGNLGECLSLGVGVSVVLVWRVWGPGRCCMDAGGALLSRSPVGVVHAVGASGAHGQ